jgi:hypothetical protein
MNVDCASTAECAKAGSTLYNSTSQTRLTDGLAKGGISLLPGTFQVGWALAGPVAGAVCLQQLWLRFAAVCTWAYVPGVTLIACADEQMPDACIRPAKGSPCWQQLLGGAHPPLLQLMCGTHCAHC